MELVNSPFNMPRQKDVSSVVLQEANKNANSSSNSAQIMSLTTKNNQLRTNSDNTSKPELTFI